MKTKLIYGILLLIIVAHAAWQWTHFSLPVLQHAEVPPAAPVVAKRSQQLNTLLDHNLWDKLRGASKQQANAEQAANKAKVVTWLLKGIVSRQHHVPVALITSDTHAKLYRQGDTLPDGSLLIQVMQRGILVTKDGKQRHVYLFKNE